LSNGWREEPGRRRLKNELRTEISERTKLRKVLNDFDSKYRSEELCQGDFYQGMRPAPNKGKRSLKQQKVAKI
jgi:hypothetical protein